MTSLIFLENPAARFPSMKTPMARHNAAFLPKISENRPYNGWNAVEVSRYVDGMNEDTDPAWNSAEMLGSAVATRVMSSVETTMQTASPANTETTLRKGSRFV